MGDVRRAGRSGKRGLPRSLKTRRPVFVETVPDSTHGGLYHTREIDEVLRRAVAALIEAGEPARRATPADAETAR